MQLPHAHRASVDPAKLSDYLLSKTHPVGRHKARVFEAMGYSAQRPGELETALHRVAREGAVSERRPSPYGELYIVDGVAVTPTGASVRLRTIWVLHAASDRPEFVTGYRLR